MNNKKQLNKEERELIQGCSNEDPGSIKEFSMRYSEKIYNYAYRFTKNHEDAEQWRQEIFMHLFRKIKTSEIKKLDAWIKRVVWRKCIDLNRKEHPSNKAIKFKRDIEDHRIIAPGSKKYHEASHINTIYRNFPPTIREGVDRSLEYIETLYNLREKLISNSEKYESLKGVLDILEKTKQKFDYKLGPVSDEITSKYKPSTFKEPFNIPNFPEEFPKQEFKVWAFRRLYDFINKVDEIFSVYGIVIDITIPILKSFFNKMLNPKSSLFGMLPTEFGLKLIEMKIKPPRLMYETWTKVKEFKKGKGIYDNRSKIGSVFAYHKGKTKGTEREFLFESIPEDITVFPKTINNLRMLSYRKPINKKFYKRLVNFIYEESFK